MFQDFVKDDGITTTEQDEASSTILSPKQDNSGSKKDVLTSSNVARQTVYDTRSHVKHSRQDVETCDPTSGKMSPNASKPIDISPLVDELVSTSRFDNDEKDNIGDMLADELPLIDLGNDLSYIIDIGDDPVSKAEENVLKQFSNVDDIVQQELSSENLPKTSAVGFSSEGKQQGFNEIKEDNKSQNVSSDLKQDAKSGPKNVKVTERVNSLSTFQVIGKALASSEDCCKLDGSAFETDKQGKTSSILKTSTQNETPMPGLSSNDLDLLSTSLSKSRELDSFSKVASKAEISSNSKTVTDEELVYNEPRSAENTSSENTKTLTEHRRQENESNLVENLENILDMTLEDQRNKTCQANLSKKSPMRADGQLVISNTATTLEAHQRTETTISSISNTNSMQQVMQRKTGAVGGSQYQVSPKIFRQESTNEKPLLEGAEVTSKSSPVSALKSRQVGRQPTEMEATESLTTASQEIREKENQQLGFQLTISDAASAQESSEIRGFHQSEAVNQQYLVQGNEEKQENIDEKFSGSELVSFDDSLVRTSNRKRKAPPPRDLSVHPPGWVRSALL